MVPDAASKPSRPGGLSLYANLLNPSSKDHAAPGTISRAPVVFKQTSGDDVHPDQATVDKQQISAASLRFQPTKRPQLSAQKVKPKTPLQKVPVSIIQPSPIPADPATAATRPPVKTSLADWTAVAEDNDVNGFYGGEKRQRGGRKKRKKNKEESHVQQNWDDIYDPSRPNNYEDYKHSDEKILEIREWKDGLYAHRMVRERDGDSDSSDDQYNARTNRAPFLPTESMVSNITIEQSAPSGFSFAPPPMFEDTDKQQLEARTGNLANASSGEDAYARRMNLSGPNTHLTLSDPPTTTRPSSPESPPPPLPPSIPEPVEAVAPEPTSKLDAAPAASISKAPVRYNLPAPPSEIPISEAELENALRTDELEEETSTDAAPRSLRPGQKGFAERLMSKYGWSKGSGLGAKGSGIVNPLRVQVEKQKKKPDSEGGGFVGPGGRGKIVGGKKKAPSGSESEEGKFGAMSEVVVLRGMVDGMDLDAEMEGSGDGGLMQEIGEECGDKYGRVERVFIDRSDASKAPVFVKFTSQLSALRAVNALQGRIFNGNTIEARFFDTDRFESGNYV